MKTVLVIYKVWIEGVQQLDGYWFEKSKIVKVTNLDQLNEMFKNIIDVTIIEQ